MEKRPRIEDHGVEGKDQIFHLDKKIDCVFARIRDIPEGCRYFIDTSKASLNEAFVALSLCFRTKAKSFPFMVLGYLIETDPRPYLLKLFRKFQIMCYGLETQRGRERVVGFDQIIIRSQEASFGNIPNTFSMDCSNLGFGLRTKPYVSANPNIPGYEKPSFTINISTNGPDGIITKKRREVDYSILLEDENHDPLFDEKTVEAIQYSMDLFNILDESFLSNFKKRFGMNRLPYAMVASMFGFCNSFYMMKKIMCDWKIDPTNDDFCLHHIALFNCVSAYDVRRPYEEIFAVDESIPYGNQHKNVCMEMFDVICSVHRDPARDKFFEMYLLSFLHEIFETFDSVTSFECKRDIIIKFLNIVSRFEFYDEGDVLDVFDMELPEGFNGNKLLMSSIAAKLFDEGNHKGIAHFERLLAWSPSDDMNAVREDILVRVILDGTIPLWTLPASSCLDRELIDRVYFRVRREKVDLKMIVGFLQLE